MTAHAVMLPACCARWVGAQPLPETHTKEPFMLRTVLTLALALSAFSCASEDDDEPLKGYSESCASDEDCETQLICGGGVCTVACTALAQCASFGVQASCLGGYCRHVCTDNSNCARYNGECEMNGAFSLPTGRGVCR